MSATTTQPNVSDATSDKIAGVSPTPPKTHQPAGIALRAGKSEGTMEYLPLRELRVDPMNARKDVPAEKDIAELADLIASQGLLQNLQVVKYPAPIKGKGKEKGRVFAYGVIAGGRRLRALQLLVHRKVMSWDEQVLCAVVPHERARAVSFAENSGREAMSVADTVQAFAEMVQAGASVEEVSVCFGVEPVTVKRRLRLADASPRLFAMFRAGELSLDQLMALCLTEDHALQEAVWERLDQWSRNPASIRRAIAGTGINSKIVKFVGVKAYEQAGGSVLRDLFADPATDDADASHIQDVELMERLAKEKLETTAAELRATEGLPWVEAMFEFSYTHRQEFKTPDVTFRAPTDAEAATEAAAEAGLVAIQSELEDLYDTSDEQDSEGQERIELLNKQESEAEDALEALRDLRIVVPDELRAVTGAVVHLSHDGKIQVERNLVKSADMKAATKAIAATANGSGPAQGGSEMEQGAAISEALCRQLTSHKTRALQAELMVNRHAVALAALAHPLIVRLLYGSLGGYESPSASSVRAESCDGQLATWASDLAESPAEKMIQETMAKWRAVLPEKAAEVLPWLLAQPQETVVELLAVCSALSINAIDGEHRKHPSDALRVAVNLDMRQWWQADGISYLSRVPKQLVADAVADAGMADEAPKLLKLKKAEAVAKASDLLAGQNWLPAVLR